jgi:hypothetical protein
MSAITRTKTLNKTLTMLCAAFAVVATAGTAAAAPMSIDTLKHVDASSDLQLVAARRSQGRNHHRHHVHHVHHVHHKNHRAAMRARASGGRGSGSVGFPRKPPVAR